MLDDFGHFLPISRSNEGGDEQNVHIYYSNWDNRDCISQAVGQSSKLKIRRNKNIMKQ